MSGISVNNGRLERDRSVGIYPLALSTVGLLPAAAQVSSFAFVDVNVLPMDRERVLKSQTIVVRDGSIVAFGPKQDVAVPEDATRIEGAGRLYVMPGLADMHIHLRREGKAWLPLYLAAGVTTVLNMGGTKNHLAWRRRVIEGNLVGPTIYSTGPQIGKFKGLYA